MHIHNPQITYTPKFYSQKTSILNLVLLIHTTLHIMETVYEASNVCITALLFGENCLHMNIMKFIYVNMYIAYSEWSEQETSSPLYKVRSKKRELSL